MIKKALKFDGAIKFDTSFPDGDPVKILSNKEFNKAFPDFNFFDHEEGIMKTVEFYKKMLQ